MVNLVKRFLYSLKTAGRSSYLLAVSGILIGLAALWLFQEALEWQKQRLQFQWQARLSDRTYNDGSALVKKFSRLTRARQNSPSAYSEEQRLLSASLQSMPMPPKPSASSQAARTVLAGMESVLGQPPPPYFYGNRGAVLLESAFFEEYARRYERAAELWRLASEEFTVNSEAWLYARMHHGFCVAMDDRGDEAHDLWKEVTRQKGSPAKARNARRLSAMLSGLQKAWSDSGHGVAGVKKLIDTGAYKKAMAMAQDLSQKYSVKANPELYYYRGLSKEETGASQDAAKDYQSIVKASPASTWARQANRRLYMLGAYYTPNKTWRQQAEKTARKQKDTAFIKQSKATAAAVVDRLDESKDELSARQSDQEVNVEAILKEAALAKASRLTAGAETTPDPEAGEEESDEDDDEAAAAAPATAAKAAPKSTAKTTTAKPQADSQAAAETKPASTQNLAKQKAKLLSGAPMSTAERKQVLRTAFQKVDKVYVEGGNIFVGVITSENPQQLTIVTAHGKVNIPKSKVAMRLKANSKLEIKEENW